MDDPFSQLPKAAVLVYAGVLTASASNTALAGQTEAALERRAPVSTQAAPQQAPTCGPACHDPNYQEVSPVEPEPVPIAPTCGPACHSSNDQHPDYSVDPDGPPPLPPDERKGCAVASLEPAGNLALLGLGLSFGVGLSIAGRRRSRTSEP